MTELSELGKAAVWYCENGFAIFPLHKQSKKPAMRNGLNGWFNDPEDARALWTRFPDYNIGITCGSPSHGLLVLDFDEDDDEGVHGLDTLAEWEDTRGELPMTATVITGRGGMHYLYRTDRTNIHPSANKDLGVDIRCDGSYIVAPPSVHPNGTPYRWNTNDAPWERGVADANANVLDLVDHVQRNGGTDEARATDERQRFKLPDKIRKGERDKTLSKYGFSLRGKGYPDDAILAMLRDANRTRCTIPMEDWEIERIAKSVCKKGPGHDGEGTFINDGPLPGKPGTSDATEDEFPQFRKFKKDGSPGPIQHNLLARGIMSHDHARKIDGSIAVWTGTKWSFGINSVKMMCTHHADDIKEHTRSEVVKYIITSENLVSVTSDNAFDGGYYVQFKNGTWDALNQCMVEPNHKMFIIGTLPIELDLDAPYGLADKFLESVSDNDEDTEKVLREIIGACICNRQVIDQALMLIGRANGITAANGKSTYIKALKALLGPSNTSTLDVGMFGKPFYVADLAGKLANLGDDIPSGYLNGDEASTWKRAVTGETIKADVKYGDTFDFNPRAVQVFSMNVIPRLSADDDGLYRRLAFVPFRRHFKKGAEGTDNNMSAKLARTENLQRLAVLGLMELPELIERGKLTEIPDMVEELENVRTSNDAVRRWISEKMIVDSDLDGRWTDEVYQEYKKWAIEANDNKLSQGSFTRRVLGSLATLRIVKTRDRAIDKQGSKFVMADSA